MERDDPDDSLRDRVFVGLGEGHDPAILQAEARHRGADAAEFAVEPDAPIR